MKNKYACEKCGETFDKVERCFKHEKKCEGIRKLTPAEIAEEREAERECQITSVTNVARPFALLGAVKLLDKL